MVHSIAARFPFTGGGTLAPYHPSAVERYRPIAPGIEISVEPGDMIYENNAEPSLYNRRGRMVSAHRKGTCLDAYL
jgi:hypothetical protein